MSKRKKGMSLNEKMAVVNQIYHEQKTVFNLKEIEKIAAKRGVVMQTVKDVNQALVDDNLIDSDKIGSGNFFWSFPSKVYLSKVSKVNRLQGEHGRTASEIETIKSKIQECDASNPVTAEYEQEERSLQSEIEKQFILKEKLDKLKQQNKNSVADIDDRLKVVEEAAERWCDNVMSVRSWMVNKKNFDAKKANQFLGITEEFEDAVENAKALARKKDKKN